MMNKTAIALGLAMVSGLSVAAQNGASAQTNVGQPGAGIDVEASINTQFDALDTNGDGVLSRAEAEAAPRVSALYESMNTSDTIEDRDKESSPNGITRAQFQAGMQAAASGSGSVGPAASGGETYTIMRDGSRKLKQGARGAASAVTGQVGDTAGQAGAAVQGQRQRVQSQSQSMQNRASDGVGKARREADRQSERARDKAAEMQQRAREQG